MSLATPPAPPVQTRPPGPPRRKVNPPNVNDEPTPPAPPTPPPPPPPGVPPPGPACVPTAEALNTAPGATVTSLPTTIDSGREPTTFRVSAGILRLPRTRNWALPSAVTPAMYGVP